MPESQSPEGLQEFREEIEKQARQQAAKWLVATIAALLAFAVSGWWFYFKPKIDNYIMVHTKSIPAGAVVAFNSSESQTCPGEDWVLFDEAKGRFILGAGHASRSELTPRQLGDTGGEENHQLTIEEMPSHRHGIPYVSSDIKYYDAREGANTAYFDYRQRNDVNLEIVIQRKEWGVGAEGGNREHNNMPPYLALYYCIKK